MMTHTFIVAFAVTVGLIGAVFLTGSAAPLGQAFVAISIIVLIASK